VIGELAKDVVGLVQGDVPKTVSFHLAS
jgi:hypothetical protein